MTEPKVICELCGENTADAPTMLDHLRLNHPDDYGDGPDYWPDGRPVVIDQTLTPEQFDQ